MAVMTGDTVLIRCSSCAAVNRVPADRLMERPKCGRCKAHLAFPNVPLEITDASFGREVLEWPGIALVFFWAPWCAHCRGMFPILEDLARRKAGIIKVGMINTERELQLARRFAVMSVPRIALYRSGGVIGELNGAVSGQQLSEWIEYSFRAG